MKYKLFIILFAMTSISCLFGVRDRIEPPQIFVNSVHIYTTESTLHYEIYKDNPVQIVWPVYPYTKYKTINLITWEEGELPASFSASNRRELRIEPLYISVDHSTETDSWKVEYIGNSNNQTRLFAMGEGGAPNRLKSQTFKTFSGEIQFSVSGKMIFKQRFKNFSGHLSLIMYPELGLISMEYTVKYPLKSLYFIKVDPFISSSKRGR